MLQICVSILQPFCSKAKNCLPPKKSGQGKGKATARKDIQKTELQEKRKKKSRYFSLGLKGRRGVRKLCKKVFSAVSLSISPRRSFSSQHEAPLSAETAQGTPAVGGVQRAQERCHRAVRLSPLPNCNGEKNLKHLEKYLQNSNRGGGRKN